VVKFNVEENIADEKALVCTFQERMDTVNSQKISDEVVKKVQETKLPVIFNLEDVDYVASAFLGLCLRVVKEVGTKNLSITNAQPNVKKVFMMAGFNREINIQ